MATKTDEETNFICMLQLICSPVPTKAVQQRFNRDFPPANIEATLKQNQNMKKLEDLRKKKRLNEKQWDLLFPNTGVTNSEKYDTTLMICLLRNLTSIMPPTSGFDRLPPPAEKGDGADLARIKYYRNMFAHPEDHVMNTAAFKVAWKTLTEAIENIGGTQYKSMCEDVRKKFQKPETKHTSTATDDKLGHFDDYLTSNFSHLHLRLHRCECYDSHELEIESWEEENKRFVKTPATDVIMNILKDKNIITITGRSGVGKSITMHHIALTFLQKKYDIIPCESPIQIFSHFKRNKYQVFILDDVCGKVTSVSNDVELWLKNEGKILNLLTNGNIKIIAASRLQVYREHQFQYIKLFTNNTIDLSAGKYGLSPETKYEILLKYIPKISDETANAILFKVVDIFPLLCYLYHPKLNIIDFFKNPFESFCQELDELHKQADKTKLCALFLLVVYNGSICKSFFEEEIHENSQKTINAVFESCGVSRGTPLCLLEKHLDAFVDIYLKKIGGQYATIHGTIFEFLCFYFGKKMQKTVIKYADSEIIRERFHLESLNEKHEEYAIIVNKENEDVYFARVLHDLTNGKVLDVFRNIQMKFEKYRCNLIQRIKSLGESKTKELLNKKEASRVTLLPLYIATHFGYTDFIRFILQHTDVNNCFEEDLPLSVACSTGNVEVVNTFIAEGFDIACSNSDGRNCLHAACETGQTRIVKILLDKGSSINTGLKNGSTPLMIASNGGYTETVKQLLQSGAKINTRNRDENTALFFACFNGHYLSAELLVTNGANITEDFGRVYPLLAACIKGFSGIASFLISKGANAKYTDLNGFTLLNLACASGSINLINILLSNGADEQVNDASYIDGTTPLMSAAARGHVQIVDLLLQHNADANYAANNGFTATMEASLNGHIPVVDFLNHNKSTLKREGKNNYTNLMAACMGSHVDMIKFLIEKGENISHRSRKQWCSLMCASKYGNDKVISFLLDKGLDINSADLLGNTALIIASFFGQFKSVDVLIKNNADINKGNMYGHSPIIVASRISQRLVSTLIEKGASINQKDLSGRSALMHACIVGNVYTVEILIDNKLDIRDIDNSKWNALMFSCVAKNADITQMLIAKGCDLKKTDENGCTPLMVASFVGNVDAVQILLDNGACINARDGLKWSPLMWSCRGKRGTVIKLLLKYGADANLTSNDNTSPLLWACEEGENQIVDLLISKTNSDNMNSWAHLMWATRKGNRSIAETLIEESVEINKGDCKGRTPFIIACCYGHSRIVELLIENKADINQMDTDGWTALNWAKRLKHSIIIDILNHHCAVEIDDYSKEQLHFMWACAGGHNDLVMSFIQNRIDINSLDNAGRTPLIEAVKYGHLSTACTLLCEGADVNKPGYHNNTPLIEVSRTGNLDIVNLLVKYKANINDSNAMGNTALIEASKHGHIDIVKMLIKNGANIWHENKKEWNATSKGRLHGNTDVVKTLENHDKNID